MHLKKFILLPMCALVLAGCGPTVIPPEDVEINATTTTLEIGDTLQLTSTITPEGADGTLAWATSDAEVATVSDAGLVTAVGLGTVDITLVVTSEETVLRDSVTLTVNPDVEAVLSSLQGDLAVAGTVDADGQPYANIATYINSTAGEEQWYTRADDGTQVAWEYNYYGSVIEGDETGTVYLADFVVDRHNELLTLLFYSNSGEPVPGAAYFVNPFVDVTVEDLTLVNPTTVSVAIDAEHPASGLFSSLTNLLADTTTGATLHLNKDASVASLDVSATYAEEVTDPETNEPVMVTTTFELHANITTPEAIGVPSKPSPMPAITGNDATIVNSFLNGLRSETYAFDFMLDGEVGASAIVTPDGIIIEAQSNSVFSQQEAGVFAVSVDETTNPVTLTGLAAEPIASSVSDLLYPVDFSADLFIPLGDNTYGLAGGLCYDTDNSYLYETLYGLDPSLAFFASNGYSSVYDINDVVISMTVGEGNVVTAATISFINGYEFLGYLFETQIDVVITELGTATFPYADATFVEWVAPAVWSDIQEASGTTNWATNVSAYLGVDIDTIPYVEADWLGYFSNGRYGAQAQLATTEEALALVNNVLNTLVAEGYTNSGLVNMNGAPLYKHPTAGVYVSAFDWQYDEVTFIVDVNFYNEASANPSSWADVDATWVETVNTMLGTEDVNEVPFVNLSWYLEADEYFGIYAQSLYYATEDESLAALDEVVAAMTAAGWSLDENLMDPNTEEPVWTKEGVDVAVSAYADYTIDFSTWQTVYYVEIDFIAYSSAQPIPAPATTWAEYDSEMAAEIEALGVDLDLVPFIDADWYGGADGVTCDFSSIESAEAFETQYVALLTEAGWTTDGTLDEYGMTIYTNPNADFTISCGVEGLGSWSYFNIFFNPTPATAA